MESLHDTGSPSARHRVLLFQSGFNTFNFHMWNFHSEIGTLHMWNFHMWIFHMWNTLHMWNTFHMWKFSHMWNWNTSHVKFSHSIGVFWPNFCPCLGWLAVVIQRETVLCPDQMTPRPLRKSSDLIRPSSETVVHATMARWIQTIYGTQGEVLSRFLAGERHGLEKLVGKWKHRAHTIVGC